MAAGQVRLLTRLETDWNFLRAIAPIGLLALNLLLELNRRPEFDDQSA
jgi:hypothetical protein